MTEKERILKIIELLDVHYAHLSECYLHHENAWQLLVATILSAQCTDNQVNIVTKPLFVRYPSIEALATCDLIELQTYVRSTGFYRNKAKNIQGCCMKLMMDFNSVVPSDVPSLTSLPGVGRKTANVIRSHIFNLPSIVVDTHVMRISQKLGLTMEKDPEKIEYDLMKILPETVWIRYNQQVIAHGREVCKARNPQCGRCFLQPYCPWGWV